jgi:hypothetical protein
MNAKQRTALIAATAAAAVIALGLWLWEPIYVLLMLAVLLLATLVLVNRARARAAEDDWDEYGSEWGLAGEDDDYVDLDARLGELGFAVEEDRRPGLQIDDRERRQPRGWDEGDSFASAAVYEVGAPAPAEDDEDEEYEEYEEAEYEDAGYEGAGYEDAGYEGAGYQETEYQETEYQETEYQQARYQEAEYEDVAAPVVDLGSGLDEEYEELVEEYEDHDGRAAVSTGGSIFAAPGVIDEEQIDSDEAILAASNATSLQYEEVLSREDANAETREILSKVASLLAKYE